MHSTSPYPSDLSDAEWALLEPLLESSERRGRRSSPPGAWRMPSSTCSGAAAPGGCSPESTRRGKPSTTTCRKWRTDGRLHQAHDHLRAAVLQAEGREPDPSGAVIDSQALKGTGVGGPERGYDGAKRLSGRKRHRLSCKPAGWCSARTSMRQACTTVTARKGS
jgi:putative transposase